MWLISFMLLGMSLANGSQGERGMKRYIITETGKFNSLDPLDADQTPNLPVARMIYSTPFEISETNELSSFILENFKVKDDGKGIELVVKKGLTFSDGTPITAEDVGLAITRMALARPQFPVIDHIEGLEMWTKGKHPLKTKPSGIKIEGQKITILFSRKVHNPLFRFCLELFSVIPQKCVNLETGKISCAEIPSSGYYKITNQDDTSVSFERTGLAKDSVRGPEKMKFEYWPSGSLADRISTLTKDDVVAGNESMFSFAQMEKFSEKQRVAFLPAARFTDLDLNPASDFFKDKTCRQIFADTFRKSFGKIAAKFTNVEASIFTRVVPGFLTLEELRAKTFAKHTKADFEACKKRVALHPFRWGYVEAEKNSAFVEALELTLKEIGYKGEKPLVAQSRKELNTWFTEGKVAITSGGSGFWAHDPVGDLQMLFTPNLHKSLDFVTKDNTLQKLIRELSNNPSDKELMTKVNQYMHDEALFNVYSYVRRFFMSSNENHSLDLPFAITSPAPWQVFVR